MRDGAWLEFAFAPERIIRPFDEARSLSAEFGSLATTGDMLDFARRYGSLFSLAQRSWLAAAGSPDHTTLHESETLWTIESEYMRLAIQLRRALVRQREKPSFVHFTPKGGESPGGAWELRREHPGDFRISIQAPVDEDILWWQAGWLLLRNLVNDRMRPLVRVGLVPVDARSTSTSPQHELVPRIENLLGAIWVDFARLVERKREEASCEVCNAPFTRGPRSRNRSDRKTCSEACRSRLKRERMATARRLREQGKSPQEIAATLGSSTQTVSRWVKGVKPR